MLRALAALTAILLVTAPPTLAQREYVPADHPVYRFLLRQSLEGHIRGFTWGMLPLSRHEVAGFLEHLRADSVITQLAGVDREILRDYEVEFSYDLDRSLAQSHTLIPSFDFGQIVRDDSRKYLYAYTDSATALFIDGIGNLSRMWSSGDSLGRAAASLGELGVRIRGTVAERVGFYLQAINGGLLAGSHDLAVLDHRRLANRKFNADEQKFYDITTGYLRYDADWFGVTMGRDQVLWGMGFGDRAVFSDNTVPFDFFRIDLHSNSVRYSFLHGSLVGRDSAGHTLASKYIAAHRIEFNAGRRVRIGFSEAVLYSNQPVNFALMNPLTFLTSAELSTELPQSGEDAHNSLIWLDLEVLPADNVRLFGSLLVDDLKFSTIGKGDISGNSNKFGWQGGALWNDAFGVPAFILSAEYTRINPFVLTHWTNFNSYTNWELSLGTSVPPNSDEWMLGVDWDAARRLSLGARLRFQRSGQSIYDANGNLTFDAGDDINRGVNHLQHPNVFLEGLRVNRTIGSFRMDWQPILQYTLRLEGFVRSITWPVSDRTLNDAFASLSLRLDY